MTNKTPSSARERIIATALNLFYRQGYLATGINQIISESQVAKATFYAHFPSKEALCIAYLQARHILWMSWLEESVTHKKTSKGKLLGVFAFLKKWMQESDYRGCAFLNIASEVPSIDSGIRNEVIRHKDDLQKYLDDIITDIFKSRGTSTRLPGQHCAKIVYVLIEGAIVSSQNYNELWPIECAQEAVEALLKL